MKKMMLWALVLTFVPLVSFAELADIDPEAQNLCVDIKSNLRVRDRDANTAGGVSLLQDFLQEKGFLKSEPTGFFGQMTLSSVKAFQTSQGISPTGFVGAYTREAIKKQSGCDGANKSQTISSTPSVQQVSTETTLPPGCTSTSGYSSVTGIACSGWGIIRATTTPSITVISPNGGETYSNGGYVYPAPSSEIAIQYKSSGIIGQNITVSLDHPVYGSVRSQSAIADNSGTIQMNLAKGNTLVQPGEYKISLCTLYKVCDSSDNYFKVVGETGTTSTIPHITEIRPDTVTPGSRVYVYGINLYGNPIAIDGIFGMYGIEYPDTSGTSFSFVVPPNLSDGKHKLSIEQKITGIPGNSIPFIVHMAPSIVILSPKGGEYYTNGAYGSGVSNYGGAALSSIIKIQYKLSNTVLVPQDSRLVAYLNGLEYGRVRSQSVIPASSGVIEMDLAKGDTLVRPGLYQIVLCLESRNGEPLLCSTFTDTFTIIGEL